MLGLGNSWCLLRKAHTRWAPTNYRLGYDFNYRGGGRVTRVTPVTHFLIRPFPPCPFIYNDSFSRGKDLTGCGNPIKQRARPGIGDTLDTTLLQSLPASFDAELYLGSISGAWKGGWKLLIGRGRFFQKCVWKTTIYDRFKRAGSCVGVEVRSLFGNKNISVRCIHLIPWFHV